MSIDKNNTNLPSASLESVIIRFAGDSGDGIQATGSMFTHDSAVLGHDISTLPDFPAEIRAPAGTRAGVSSFQLNFSSRQAHTPGDQPDVLVAMNPAALAVHLKDLVPGGVVILNEDAFTEQNFRLADVPEDPREDGTLDGYTVHSAPITQMTVEAVKPSEVTAQQAQLCKNMFTLGLVCWIFSRPTDFVEELVQQRFAKKDPKLLEANVLALHAGYNFAETAEMFTSQYRVDKSHLPPGKYRRISGNSALAMGLVAAGQLADKRLMYITYPITPATDILHELAKLRHFDVLAGQVEDEIAAMGAVVGAAYGGALAVTGTSGPGLALKSEAINLAVMAELPAVIVNVQRGGPSTGMPTKTEQSDLLQACFGRNGESPIPVIAPQSPADCFDAAIEASRIALRYMTPVLLLSDGYVANGSEPWRMPEVADLARIDVDYCRDAENFQPYQRDPETLARPWAVPGTPGMEHRIGGLEKEDITGNVSADPENHQKMVQLRADKIAGISRDIPDLSVMGPEQGDLLVLGWGSTGGAIRAAVEKAQARGASVACAQLRHINPFPQNLAQVLGNYKQVLIPELNMGQLRMLIRAEYLVDAVGLNKVQGLPFKAIEIEQKIDELLENVRLTSAVGQ